MILAATAILFVSAAGEARAFDHSHSAFTSVLKQHVRGGSFDYEALKSDPKGIESYLGSLAAVKESEFNGWSEKQQIAFLANLYNAATLKLVVDHYPVKSIKNIGGTFSSPWKQKVVDLFGSTTTLDHIEHGLLRVNYKEPRVHFAVNCASVGCPNLRSEAFQANRLDAQLDEQARVFLADKSRNRVEGNTLYLSPIFDWFAGDFTKNGTVEEFVAPYFSGADRKAIAAGGLKVKYTDYNWSLNKP